MSEQKKMDAILEAIPWRCFHCDFITSDRAEAQAHFGDRDDGEEFKPICKWWDIMDDEERKEAFQDAMRDLNEGAQENMNLREQVEDLEGQIGTQESQIRSYKPFKDCRSIYDIFCLYDSMEGRALAAEEREKCTLTTK
jgi:hypothetical protein